VRSNEASMSSNQTEIGARPSRAQSCPPCRDVGNHRNNYADVVYAIAIFNEPEDELADTNFFNDRNIGGSTQSQRMNYVWSQTFKVIRAQVPGIKIMGPNFEDYRPQYYSSICRWRDNMFL